jgi:ribonuclease BN (tRNA processing enzyme)
MKLTSLGAGSAFTLKNLQSNFIVEIGGKRLLIDAGTDLRHALQARSMRYHDLHAVYISHLHFDHMGGMEFLAFCTKFDPTFVDESGQKRKLIVFIHPSMVAGLWDTLKHGCTLPNERTTLETFFDVRPCTDGEFTFEGTKFTLVRTTHYFNGPLVAPSYGLQWQAANGKVVFLTTDTTLTMEVATIQLGSDLIFQDCETTKTPSGVHAHYTHLVALPAEVKRRMWLYHYQDGAKPDCVQDGFAGWIESGQVFDLSA